LTAPDGRLARLTVHFPFQPTRSFLVEGDADTVIGRDPDCDIVLDDDRVSRRHARLGFSRGAWRLVDLDSTNGTSLQGRPLREVAFDGDGWISFGGLIARLAPTTAEDERAAARHREERFRISISTQRELNPSLGLPGLLERVLGSVLQLSGAERGAVLLRRDDGELEIAARRNLADPDLTADGFSGSIGAIERVLATSGVVAVSDAMADPYLQERESVITGRIRALIGIPLVAAGRLIGAVYADSHEPGSSFGELDVEILEALAAHAALAIVVARADRELKGLAARLPAWAEVRAHHEARARQGS
jgi:hypothetical protein